jgi:hypothetical protein
LWLFDGKNPPARAAKGSDITTGRGQLRNEIQTTVPDPGANASSLICQRVYTNARSLRKTLESYAMKIIMSKMSRFVVARCEFDNFLSLAVAP